MSPVCSTVNAKEIFFPIFLEYFIIFLSEIQTTAELIKMILDSKSIHAECRCWHFTEVYLSHFNGECVQGCSLGL